MTAALFSIRALADGDWDDVRRIYADGIATMNATFETEVPAARSVGQECFGRVDGCRVDVDDQMAG